MSRAGIVAYTVPDYRCVVRIRKIEKDSAARTNSTILHMDFCKITYYRRELLPMGGVYYSWFGDKTALCLYGGWDNYYGDVSGPDWKCGFKGRDYDNYVVYNSIWDPLYMFFGGPEVPTGRDTRRMVESFDYIRQLLTGKPY